MPSISSYTHRLILGTVQLGMHYGIANFTGRPSFSEAQNLINMATAHGIHYYDTAQHYAESEKTLGQCLAAQEKCFSPKVITKISLCEEHENPQFFQASVNKSLQALQSTQLFCLMLHNEQHLHLLQGTIEKNIIDICRKNNISHLGCSVYTPEKALEALQHSHISVVQIPASIFDRRFEEAGVFKLAQKLQKKLHIRSVFLQGLLLMPPKKIPAKLQPLSLYVQKFHEICRQEQYSPAALALAWALRRWPHSSIIFGVETCAQLQANLKGLEDIAQNLHMPWESLDAIHVPQKAHYLNPSKWKDL